MGFLAIITVLCATNFYKKQIFSAEKRIISVFFVFLLRMRCALHERTESKAIAHSLPLESGKFELTVDDEHVARALVYT